MKDINDKFKWIISELVKEDVGHFDKMLEGLGKTEQQTYEIGMVVKDAYERLNIDEEKLIKITLYHLGFANCQELYNSNK